MENKSFDREHFTILDGALGTMLQKAGMAPGAHPEAFGVANPEILVDIHRQYVRAGAQILCANTFGANGLKLSGSGLSVEKAITHAVDCARQAALGRARVALDVGPLGEMLEPGGTLSFEAAYDLFAEVMRAGAQAGADLIMLETLTDLSEVKAAVLAAKEHTKLPVMASMTFEREGRTFAGASIEGFAAAIGGLGVAALGINCALGPADVMPLAQRLCDATVLPVFIKANAGLPDPNGGGYSLSAADFCEQMQPCLANGVSMVGGCCGTTPETISALTEAFAEQRPAARSFAPQSRVCGNTGVMELDAPAIVGERINPTGKKKLREALQSGDLSYIQTLAVEQASAGAAILDVNVGAPGVDEVQMLPLAVRTVQAVCGLPLMLDSSNPEALGAALRVCTGKPVVNSTSGEHAKLTAVLPLCKQYGAAVVGLTMDEESIPETAEGRLAIAEKILSAALEAGLPREDVWIDCLTMAVGAQPGAAVETLRAVRLVKEKLGLKTILGVSNISFGLPGRPALNRAFLQMALANGLDLAILNPCDEATSAALLAGSALTGAPGAMERYVRAAGEAKPAPEKAASEGLTLDAAIERGLKHEAAAIARQLLQAGELRPLALVQQYLVPALDRVGKGFETGRVFLPQLLSAAGAAQAAFEVVRGAMDAKGAAGPAVVVATVQGDIHDIGKNIAKAVLESYGTRVIDLGRDVPPERVVQAVRENDAKLVGLSALMTTTLPAMQATIQALHEAGLPCKIWVGGAVLTEEYAKSIGADFYARDAMASAEFVRAQLAEY